MGHRVFLPVAWVTIVLQKLQSAQSELDRYDIVFGAWRQKVARRPLDERQQHALMLPIVAALQATLPEAIAWEKLVAPTAKQAHVEQTLAAVPDLTGM